MRAVFFPSSGARCYELGVHRLALLATAALLSACMLPPPASERVTDAARELNLATRFGRMDVAVSRTAAPLRQTFMRRRASWGGELRIVDLELVGLNMPDNKSALIEVDVSWVRMQDGRLRTTRVAQVWRDQGEGWLLTREKRLAGDLGLFGEPVKRSTKPPVDVHFATKTIR
jgi:hypothetical protein